MTHHNFITISSGVQDMCVRPAPRPAPPLLLALGVRVELLALLEAPRLRRLHVAVLLARRVDGAVVS